MSLEWLEQVRVTTNQVKTKLYNCKLSNKLKLMPTKTGSLRGLEVKILSKTSLRVTCKVSSKMAQTQRKLLCVQILMSKVDMKNR